MNFLNNDSSGFINCFICLVLGVVVTNEQITNAIAEHIKANKESLINDRYKVLGPLLAKAKQIPSLRWANGVAVKEELEKQVIALIGPKDERDMSSKGKVCVQIDTKLFD